MSARAPNTNSPAAPPAARCHPLGDVLRDLPAESAPAGDARRALCVVTSAQGSTPQVAGAALMVRADRRFVGTVGGGFVESAVLDDGVDVLTTGLGVLRTYDLTHVRGETTGAVCGGIMEVALIPLAPEDAVAADIHRFCRDLEAASAGAALDLPVRDEQDHVLAVRVAPAPSLIVVGAGHCGRALAELCVTLDFRVTVVDDRAAFVDPASWPSAVELVHDDPAAFLRARTLDASSHVAIVTRGHQQDYEALRAVVDGAAGYVGLIGSRRKSGMIFKDLRADGVPEEHLDAVRTPIGIAIGAQTVPEIAVSIAAELIQHRRSRPEIKITLERAAQRET